MAATLKTCADTHEEIIYSGGECPLCRQRLLLDQSVDQKEDLEESNIVELFHELKKVQHRLAKLERATFGQQKQSWWQNILRPASVSTSPLQHASFNESEYPSDENPLKIAQD